MSVFADNLAFSHGFRGTDLATLQSMIVGCQAIRVSSLEEERLGVDYVATLRGGREVNIDAKRRSPGTSDFWAPGQPEVALETWSVVENRITGWTLSESSHMELVLFTFDGGDHEYAYLRSFQLLRMAFRHNLVAWYGKYRHALQNTEGRYHSECVFVPLWVVDAAIHQISRSRVAVIA